LALILAAVEENLEEQNAELTAAGYFVSFLSLLDQAFSSTEIDNKDLANSSVYLLDLVAPYTSRGLLKSKFEPILQKLALCLSNPEADAPLLRAAIGVLETILIAQDGNAWVLSATQMSPRRAMMGLLALAQDPRPKVRKRAQDAIAHVLRNPPPSPKFEHPASVIAAETALQAVFKDLAEGKHKKKTDLTRSEEKVPKVIHDLQLVRAICNANQWPSDKIEPLCEVLLTITRTSDQFMVVASFNVFEALFKSITDEVNAPKLVRVLDTIFDLKPSIDDLHLAPAWLAVVAQAGSSYANLQSDRAFFRLPQMFNTVVEFFKAEGKNVYESASQCLVALMSTCIPAELLLLSDGTPSEESDKVLRKISNSAFGLLHVQYHGCWKEVTDVLVALFDQLRWRASPHLVTSLKVVGALRGEESFAEGRQDSDKVIAAAIRSLGPEEVLEHLPLNLDPGKSTGRAWLLPLLRDNIQHASLSQFVNEFVPLSEQFVAKIDELKNEAGKSKERAMQVKIYETLNEQIWSLLPRYCDLPFDLRKSFNQTFAETLSNVLYEAVEFRSGICLALRLLVESNVAYSQGAVDDDILLLQRFPKNEAEKNVKYLSEKFASKILSVLFNVFSQTLPEFRNYILDCIYAYLAITTADDVEATFNKVSSLLHSSLEQEAKGPSSQKTAKGSLPPMSQTMMDLVVATTPFLPKSSHNTLLTIFVTLSNMSNSPLLQKKAFRALTRLAETESGEATILENMANIENVFIQLGDKVTSPARGARLQALAKVTELLPASDLHFIPCILSETVVSTKDVNEKTREAAFNLLVQIGRKMQQGGIVKHSKVPDMDQDAPDVEATLEEYFTMVSAGLAGSTPHMISATITSLSRILFEFRADISTETLRELASTVELFLTSNSREIVKSTLGFVKITAISLPVEIVEPELKSLIERLLVWSHEHKAHFRSKVKHIIERLVRRFGYDKIAANFPEEDMKLLTNIRKSKERAKRRNKSEEDDNKDHLKQGSKKSAKFSNEFDEAIYGSSSDESDNESDVDMGNTGQQRANKYIVEGEDEPLDLLDRGALAHISSTKPKKKQDKPFFKASSKFAKDDTGRIVIKENGEVNEDDLDIKSGIDAYVEAIKNGPVRGQRNKLKYKRARKFNESDDEDDGDEPEEKSKQKDTRSNVDRLRAKLHKRPKKMPRRKL
jgi:ribosomal RNA-processing protein 12